MSSRERSTGLLKAAPLTLAVAICMAGCNKSLSVTDKHDTQVEERLPAAYGPYDDVKPYGDSAFVLPPTVYAWQQGLGLDGLPDVLTVTHDPNPVKPNYGIHNTQGGPKSYMWLYSISLQAANEAVTIERWGTHTEDVDQSYTRDEFAESFNCPNATLLPGQQYTMQFAWVNAILTGAEKATWYFVGITESGKRVKGIGVIQGLPIPKNHRADDN